MRRSLEQMEAIGQEMMEYALELGLLEGVIAITSDGTVKNPPMTIHYKDGRKKTISFDEVKAVRQPQLF